MNRPTKTPNMLIHASCAARAGNGVLFTGPPGSGKSDLLFRLLDRGYTLVADDRVNFANGMASPPAGLEGLLEVRGIGIVRLPFVSPVRLRLSVVMGRADRLPSPTRDAHGVPQIRIDPSAPAAAQQIDLALDCALGLTTQIAGAFAPC